MAAMPAASVPSLPAITVAAVTETGGRFLVVEELIEGQRLFNQPAGHVEAGETLLAAVAREAREETAWRFTPEALLGVYLWRSAWNGRSFLRFAFTGKVSDHDPAQPLDEGILGTHWLSLPELKEQTLRLRSPLVLRCVEDYLAGRRSPLAAVAHLDLATAREASIAPVLV